MNVFVPRLSPDGSRLAATTGKNGLSGIWTCEIERCVLSPLTAGIVNVWSPDGTEIFLYGDGGMVRIPADGGDGPQSLPELFEWPRLRWPPARHYDVTPDGQRFVMVKRMQEPRRNQIRVVVNWAEELKQKVPTDN